MSRSRRKDRHRQEEKASEASGAQTSQAASALATDSAESADLAVSGAIPETAENPTIVTRDVTPAAEPLDSMSWPEKPWPAAEARGGGFQVVMRRSVLNSIHAHGTATSEVEICGVLVGNVYRDSAGPFLLVEAMIQGDFAGNTNAQVTFTAQTWNHIQSVMESQHPQRKIVGWYHTHPDFGIFLSDMDLFIHGNFFNMPWQIAFVFDPINNEEGVFVWRDGKTERTSFAVEEDADKEPVRVPVSNEMTAAALADFSRRMQQMERRQKRVMVALPFLLLLMVAWPFILFTALSDRQNAPAPMAMPNQPIAATTASSAAVLALTPATTKALLAAATTAPASQLIALVVHAPPASAPAAATAPAVAREPVAVSTTAPVVNPADKFFTPTVIRPTPTAGPKILDNPDSDVH